MLSQTLACLPSLRFYKGFGCKFHPLVIALLVMSSLLLISLNAGAEDNEPEQAAADSISQVNFRDQELKIHETGGLKALARTITVGKDDYLWKIFRRFGLLGNKNTQKIISVFRKLNPSLQNRDVVFPGQQLIIPVKIIPAADQTLDTVPSRPESAKNKVFSGQPKVATRMDFKESELKPEAGIKPAGPSYSSDAEKKADNQIDRDLVKKITIGKSTPAEDDSSSDEAGSLAEESSFDSAPSDEDAEVFSEGAFVPALDKDTKSPAVPKLAVKKKESKRSIFTARIKPFEPSHKKTASPYKKAGEDSAGVEALDDKTVPSDADGVSDSIKAGSNDDVVSDDESESAIQDDPVEVKQKTIEEDLYKVLAETGGEWVKTGEHFIPLMSGGQLNLKAKNFPIVSFNNGKKVIVDLRNKLPEELAGVVRSHWGNYRFVHLDDRDDLRSALDKILPVCGFSKVFEKGEPYEFRDDLFFSVTGDWVVAMSEGALKDRPRIVVINLEDRKQFVMPSIIKKYFQKINIKIIEYPADEGRLFDKLKVTKPWKWSEDISVLVGKLLALAGYDFKKQVEIPVYRDQPTDFNLTVTADFFLEVAEKDTIIDLSGLNGDMVGLLRRHDYQVCSLSEKNKALSIAKKVLVLLGIKFNPGPLSFKVMGADLSNNVEMTLPGISFSGRSGDMILLTPVDLPNEIATYFSQKGYTSLVLLPRD
jgi:hypothetical protein